MTLKLITKPAAEPVTLAEAKLQAKIEHDVDDTLVSRLIADARGHAEHLTGKVFIYQTWERVLDAFPQGAIELGKSPVSSVASVTYTDTSGAQVVLDPASYTLDDVTDDGHGWLLPSAALQTWPNTYDAANVVRVRFVSGYGADGDSVPEEIRHYILLEVSTGYKFREHIMAGVTISELPGRFHERKLDRYRRWGI